MSIYPGQGISPADRHMWRSSPGFTLLEMVCVLAIIGLIIGIALPALSRGLHRVSVEAAANRIAARLKETRSVAIETGRPSSMIFDKTSRQLIGPGGRPPIVVAQDLDWRVTLSGSCRFQAGTAELIYYPDGRSCGGDIYLSGGNVTYKVSVNWLTGATRVISPSAGEDAR